MRRGHYRRSEVGASAVPQLAGLRTTLPLLALAAVNICATLSTPSRRYRRALRRRGWLFPEVTVMRMIAVIMAAVLTVPAAGRDAPKGPTPQKEHEWLQQLVGEWETEAEMVVAPGQPTVKCKGTETVRTLGGLWILGEHKGDFMGVPVNGVMTVGYDQQKKKFVGTWVCSMCEQMFQYEGSLSGNVLTLETEGPNPTTGKTAKMRDVMEVKD